MEESRAAKKHLNRAKLAERVKSPTWRTINILAACLQNMTLGGLLFGWASISGTLLISGTEKGGPGLTREYVHIMFVIALFFNFLGPLLLGIVLDTYGPRVCSIASIVCIAIGCILFATSNIDNNPLFIPAMALIAFGGPGAQNAIIHLSNLFPTWKATATAVITGSFQLSFFVFVIFDHLWQFQHWDYQSLFTAYSFICALNILISFLLWPDKPYSIDDILQIQESDDATLNTSSHNHGAPASDGGRGNHTHPTPKSDAPVKIGAIRLPSTFMKLEETLSATNSPVISPSPSLLDKQTQHAPGPRAAVGVVDAKTERSTKPSSSSSSTRNARAFGLPKLLKDKTLKEQLLSSTYINLCILFTASSFWANFYIGTIDLQLGDSHIFSLDEQKLYGRIFTAIMTFGFIGIPIVGAMMDKLGFPATATFTCSMGVIWALLLVYNSRTSVFASFFFYAIFRTFLFTFIFAYIADTLGFKYFGLLAGLMFVIGGLVGCAQYPIAQWATGTCHFNSTVSMTHCDRGHWSVVNLIMLASMLASFAFPYADWIIRRRSDLSAAGVGKPQYGALIDSERGAL